MPSELNRLKVVALGCLLAILPPPTWSAPAKPAHGDHAMIASVHRLATEAGLDVLRRGGNAVDAAVAVAYALAVVHPQAGNLGGGGFMLIRLANGEVHFLDFREKAPAGATRDMYLDGKGEIVRDASVAGYKSIGVPGTVAGLTYAQRHWGKHSLAANMQAAIDLAKNGFPLSYEDADDIRSDKFLPDFPEARRVLQRNGNFYNQYDVLKQPELGATLERIAADPDTFYKGALAREIVADLHKHGALITEQDLASYEVKERPATLGKYRNYEIISAPPPSSGGVALVEGLNILEGYDLRKFGANSAKSIHLIVEAFRRAMYDRADFLGDPDFAQVPAAQLTDKKWAAAWRATIDPNHASPSKQLQRPSGVFPELDRISALVPQINARHPVHEHDQTTHFSIVDKEGNAVSMTTTLNDNFGSRVMVTGLGFLLNDEMDDFAAKQGVANMYGLIQGPANAIAPEKRPLSAMTPTIVLRDGKLFLVLGSPGGPRIITTVANILIDVVDYGMSIQEAVNAPRFHHQWLPDSIRMEHYGLPADAVNILSDMGHQMNFTDYWGDGECIEIDPRTGERLGASDYRNNGKAMGY